MRCNVLAITLGLVLLIAPAALAANPPETINYQGVLRDSAGIPLNGSYRMVFRFYDSDLVGFGNLLLTDAHDGTGGSSPVTVTNGLFGVALGSGALTPGFYSTLGEMFQGLGTVWLAVKVEDDPTMTPYTRILSAAYALNALSAGQLAGRDAEEYLDTSTSEQTKNGVLNLLPLEGARVALLGRVAQGAAIVAENSGASCYAHLATDDSGVWAQCYEDYGVEAWGSPAGGHFKDMSGTGEALVGYGNIGLEGYGTSAGGHFVDSDSTGYAYVGYGDRGIHAYGTFAGGWFQDTNGSSYANVAYGDRGIDAHGSEAGGMFVETDSSASGAVAKNGYKLLGSGTNPAFVQNHPYDKGRVIVYTALEGDEVGTYTRGTARLASGIARVALDGTFGWVTNPDIGLTAQVTPRGEWADLYVESLTTKELVVRSAGKASDTVFDYVVNGLRLGHEEVSIVQEKQEEARIPAIMAFHQGQYVRYPKLREYSALSRFLAMHADVSGSASPMNFAASDALRAAVEVYDPVVHGPVGTPPPGDPEIEQRATTTTSQPAVPLGDARATAAPSTGAPSIPMDAEGNVYGRSFRPSASDVAGVMPAGEPLEPGDVVVFDGAIPGELRRGRDAGDPAVAGCIVAEPGLLLGANRVNEGGTAALATSGMVRCKADAGYGAIAVGDLLTVSATPGHAMRAADPRPGTILGKAVEPLAAGAGLIKVLVMLR